MQTTLRTFGAMKLNVQKQLAFTWQSILLLRIPFLISPLRFGFTICAFPKSGSTMIGLLMRRMMHYQNWNTIGGSINHDHGKSGLRFLEDVKNPTFLKALTRLFAFQISFVRFRPSTPIWQSLKGSSFGIPSHACSQAIWTRFATKDSTKEFQAWVRSIRGTNHRLFPSLQSFWWTSIPIQMC